jgi:hypothetical protein
MAKTATGKRFLSSILFLNSHFILETVTKSATKAANSKTNKAGESDVYMRLHSFAISFSPYMHPTLANYTFYHCYINLRQAQARALRLSDLLQREHEEMERGESRPR